MLINCPRCKFQQPKDTYCAQCGVDMTQFKPPRAPFLKRIVLNPLLQVVVLVLVISSVFLLLYKETSPDLTAREKFLRSNVQVRAASAPIVQPPPEPEIIEEPAVTELASEEVKQITAEKNTPPQEAPAPATAVSLGELTIEYLEMSSSSLNTMIEISRQRGQFMNFSDYAAGVIPNFSQVVSQITSEKLDTKTKKINREHTVLQWEHTVQHDNETLGLTSFFEIVDAQTNSLRGNLEIQRAWRATGDDMIEKKSFPAIFELTAGSAFFMTGIIPQGATPDEDELAKVVPFKILKSTKYRGGESELVIIFRYIPQRISKEGTP